MTEAHHSRWHDTRAMLTGLLAWLDATQQWVETAVSDPEAQRSQERLTPDTGLDASVSVSRSEPERAPAVEATARPDLFALLAEMTALRQEVKLQTRSARSDREQAAQTLDQLSSVVTEVVQRQQSDDAPPDHVGVDALVELHDALSRAERQGRLLMTETVHTLREWGRHAAAPPDGSAMQHDASEPSEPVDRLPPQTPESQPRRWFRRRRREPLPSPAPAPVPPLDPEVARRAAALCQIGREAEQMADRLEGLSTGYGLGIQRLERLLAACGIEPIECIGKPVDAELMEVVQLVTESGQPDGVVVDEVRRGYHRAGQVYRFAQVVAARLPSTRQQQSTGELSAASPIPSAESTGEPCAGRSTRPEAGGPLPEDGHTQQEVDGCRHKQIE